LVAYSNFVAASDAAPFGWILCRPTASVYVLAGVDEDCQWCSSAGASSFDIGRYGLQRTGRIWLVSAPGRFDAPYDCQCRTLRTYSTKRLFLSTGLNKFSTHNFEMRTDRTLIHPHPLLTLQSHLPRSSHLTHTPLVPTPAHTSLTPSSQWPAPPSHLDEVRSHLTHILIPHTSLPYAGACIAPSSHLR
jgi:hypothetical protein